MQIKKFEARTMKEALEMVKLQLGPDAVILSAKEVNKGFGLGGEKSIEITAAFSETVLQQKKYVEAKMPDHLKEAFAKTSARIQKETLKKALQSQQNEILRAEKSKRPVIPPNITQRKYVEIDREDDEQTQVQARNSLTTTVSSSYKPTTAQLPRSPITQVAQKAFNNLEVDHLKQEIEQLKNLLHQFKTVPQSFVQAHPGAENGVNYNLSKYFSFLTEKGVSATCAGQILKRVQDVLKPEQQANKNNVEGLMGRIILNSVPLASDTHDKFHLFVGPSGVGKTTTMIKLASQLVLKQGKRVALISTDTLKIGADEQMKIYSQILNLPFIAIRSEQDWQKLIPYLDQVDHVLVDFASLQLKNNDEIEYLAKMSPPQDVGSTRTHLVLSALSKDSDLTEIYRRYSILNIQDVIFTGLDEAAVHGNIYNFSTTHQVPLFGFGIGSRTPEDYEVATAERVVDLIFNITSNSEQQGLSL